MSAAQLQLPLDEVFFALLRFRIYCLVILIILFFLIMKPVILLGLLALILFPSGGEANIQVHQHALLHGSVSMSPSQKMGTVRSLTWKFAKNGSLLNILDNTDKPYHVYPSQFKGRLQISNDLLTLTIMNLTLEDSGIYTNEITDTNGRIEVYSSNVTVYEPIPLPVISTDVKENTTDRCNVTLHCSVPSHPSDVSYTWKSRRRNSAYKLCHTGSIIQISLTKSSRDMEYLCIVQNPVQEKSVPIQVQEICGLTEDLSSGRHYAIVIAIAVLVTTVLLVMFAVICIWRRCKRRKEPIENKNTEMHYIEVTTHQRDRNQIVHMGNDHSTPPQRTKAETLYSVLQYPPPKYT